MTQEYSRKFEEFIAEEKAATDLISSVSKLLYNKGVELVLFRKHLIDKNVSDILRIHQYATNFVKKPISIFDSSQIAKILTTLDLAPAKIDIGKLTYEYAIDKNNYTNQTDFLNQKIDFIINSDKKKQQS